MIFVHEKDFRLVKCFLLAVPKSKPSADSDDQDLFDAQHVLTHATFSEEKYAPVLRECE